MSEPTVGKPFEVEIDCGAGSVVRFTLSEEELLTDRDPMVRGTAQAGDRMALRTAAFDRVTRIITRNVTEPVVVVDGDSAWIIPTHSIRMIRFRDPEVGEEKRPFGFVKRVEGGE
jgi:hypothetical protein